MKPRGALAVRLCEDRVLDGPASGQKGSKGGHYKYCNPRTCMNYHKLEAVPGFHSLASLRQKLL